MEAELIRHLLTLLQLFSERKGLAESTIGRLCIKDGAFFPRLRAGSSLSVRKYDEIVLWFSESWPEGLEWPEDINRPTRSLAASSEAAE
ncbi:hypothetical protein EN802_13775 [bacterium M00.F.Ca.ET.159.01.1.1]|nr:hypothetical protein EN802_13775 [bacterium M00.F.Ca.ET.159.01.1.1]